MRFLDLLKEANIVSSNTVEIKHVEVETVQSLQEKESPEEMLRSKNFKIKLITPTKFGTQIDFAKSYDEEDIKEILKDFSIKIKDKSVFIIK